MKNLMKIAIAMLAFAALSFGQTAASTTTLGAAVTATTCSTLTVTLASTSTMQGLGAGNAPQTILYMDKERMDVSSVTDSTHVVALRCKGLGAANRPVAHINGSTVYFVNGTSANPAAGFLRNEQPSAENSSGACTRTNLVYVPVVYQQSGNKFDCLGGQWVQTNAPGMPVLASATVTIPAGVFTPTGNIMITDTGTAAMTGITVPAGWQPGMCLEFVPGGAFTWTTATNIAASGTAVAAKVTLFCWDGTKWAANI